jgi:hypothetical protein
MKKILTFLSIGVCMHFTSNAQLNDVINKAKTATTVAAATNATGLNVSDLSSSILGKLTPALNLTTAQQPKVGSAVTNFLTAKSKILPLLSTNKAAYTQKLGGLFGNLKTKLAGILLKNQMSKFMGLKSTSSSPTNVLSNLFK